MDDQRLCLRVVSPLGAQGAVEHEQERSQREDRLGQDYREKEGSFVHRSLVLLIGLARRHSPAVLVAVTAVSTLLRITSMEAELASMTGCGCTP